VLTSAQEGGTMSKKEEQSMQPAVDPTSWMEEFEGQLAIDVYQTPSDIVIKAPIAGVRPEDLDVAITEELVTIRGERHDIQTDTIEGYLVQECYWGPFSRTYQLPVAVDSDKAQARLTGAGILTITIPKAAKSRTKSIAVQLD
jgi:HSP20 family protein